MYDKRLHKLRQRL